MTYRVVVETDIWTVLTAVGTVSAVIAALLGTWYGVTAARRERRRMEDQAAQSDARKVLVVNMLCQQDDGVHRTSYDAIVLINASTEPVLEAFLLDGSSNPSVDSMPRWRWVSGNGGSSHAQVVLPGESHQFGGMWQPVDADSPFPPSNADRSWFTATVTWSDARDRHWIRRGQGEPVELRMPTRYGQDVVPRYRRDLTSPVVIETRELWAQNEQALATASRQQR